MNAVAGDQEAGDLVWQGRAGRVRKPRPDLFTGIACPVQRQPKCRRSAPSRCSAASSSTACASPRCKRKLWPLLAGMPAHRLAVDELAEAIENTASLVITARSASACKRSSAASSTTAWEAGSGRRRSALARVPLRRRGLGCRAGPAPAPGSRPPMPAPMIMTSVEDGMRVPSFCWCGLPLAQSGPPRCPRRELGPMHLLRVSYQGSIQAPTPARAKGTGPGAARGLEPGPRRRD